MKKQDSYTTVLKLANERWLLQKGKPIRISCPTEFQHQDQQPNAFAQPPAKAEKIIDVETKGDVTNGVRCDRVTFIPHCHGTHTECAGHITKEPIPVSAFVEGHEAKPHHAILITVEPEKYSDEMTDSYSHAAVGDFMITRKSIEAAILRAATQETLLAASAVIVRCRHDNYTEGPANKFSSFPYYSKEAIKFIRDHFSHHLTNLPSIDRERDGGTVPNHRRFFKVPKDKKSATLFNASGKIEEHYKRTNTEMCFIPADVKDGAYVVHLQLLNNWDLDAAPSAPVIFEAEEVNKEGLQLHFGF